MTVAAPTVRAPRKAASASSPNGRVCTLQTPSPAASSSARRTSGSVSTSYGSTVRYPNPASRRSTPARSAPSSSRTVYSWSATGRFPPAAELLMPTVPGQVVCH